MSQQGFEVDIIWETEAIRFSKQVEDEIRKNGSAQSENSTVKNPENPNAEELKTKDSNISKDKENLRENSTVKNPTAEEPKTKDSNIAKDKENLRENSTVKNPTAEENLHTISQEQDEALEESEWAFEAQLHDAAGVGPEDDKIWEKYYKINKKKD